MDADEAQTPLQTPAPTYGAVPEAACDGCSTEACSWCESADGVHALCFSAGETPASGWSCD